LVSALEGQTVLQAAKEAGKYIPTLCAHEDLAPFGACRLCIVEIDGVRGYPTSCTTPATDGMVVRTQSPELEQLRNNTLELMLSGHPNSCLVCDHREDCEKYRPQPTKAGQSTRCGTCSNRSECTLRVMSLAAPARALNLPTLYSPHKLERDDPFIERNHNLCVLCGRCWRICEQLHGTPAISIVHRGREARIGTAFDRSWVESNCTFCGACVDICPTGTLTDRFARWYPAQREEVESVCLMCPQACSLQLIISQGQVVATQMTSFQQPARLCALGRFAFPQILSSALRLLQPMIREQGDLTPVLWDEAMASVAGALQAYRDGSFVAVVGEPQTRETRWVYERLAVEVMRGRLVSIPTGMDELPSAMQEDLLAGRIKALWITGDFLPERLLERVEYLIVTDFLPGDAARKASAVFPAAVLAEDEGTFRGADGKLKSLPVPVPARGAARPEWTIVRDVAKAMGAGGFDYQGIADVIPTGEFRCSPPKGEPRDRVADLVPRFRGHQLADIVPALQPLGLPATKAAGLAEQLVGFLVVEKEEIVPNFHRLVIEAPAVARHAKPGQFAVVMVSEKSERAPFTLVDWDQQRGTITLVVEEVGRSSQEIARLQAGQRIAHVSGPLGLPLPIGSGSTVVLGGGCYGVGSILPIARALKQAGSRVISVIEGCSAHMLYMEEQLRAASDRLYLATKDGSRGRKGGVQEVFLQLHQEGLKIDRFIAIGCAFMMRMVAEKTAGLGIPLQVALNPIMVDGTGMCGACRVSVGAETKFACVDGPFFDGHAVDWNELFARRNAYMRTEIEAIPQSARSAKRLLKEPLVELNPMEEAPSPGR
jgi:NAD(P)H-flavin reductase/ferredoxin